MRLVLVGLCVLASGMQACAFRGPVFMQPSRSSRASVRLLAAVDRPAVVALPTPVKNEALEAKARAYFGLGNKVKQQLGPTRKEDLETALADDFEFVAPLVGPL